MKITLNNKQTETAATNIDELAKELSLPERGVAIAVNANMVRRDEWTATALAENDNVLVINGDTMFKVDLDAFEHFHQSF